MSTFQTSVIIPVYNKWDLTRDCLKSLAATIDTGANEIIVIDNASTDRTPRAAPFLGTRLFGDNFKYIRNDINRNFAGASNQGAELASGEFLVFLNNDTAALPGWLPPLLRDFDEYPNIAATGPVLLYPDEEPFGLTVQHLGIIVSPFLKFGHLYAGVPEASPLVAKRRFFQAITAACMVMPRSLFMETGKFDEEYINGFEDVDLCGRLSATGRRFTVNPASRVIHREGQSPGRHNRDRNNYGLLLDKSLKFFQPDWQSLLAADNFTLDVDAWGMLRGALPLALENDLDRRLPTMTRDGLKKALLENIYWERGWRARIDKISGEKERAAVADVYFNLCRTIPAAAYAAEAGRLAGDDALRRKGETFLKLYNAPPEKILSDARASRQLCQKLGLAELAAKFAARIDNFDSFIKDTYPRYQRDYFSLLNNRV
ncbi:MAG: glycosyltransferase family 2 protein [Desulfovibrio sp.]|nr:glycosyltransferase family 2 protein [Desulfovibrio sp.]